MKHLRAIALGALMLVAGSAVAQKPSPLGPDTRPSAIAAPATADAAPTSGGQHVLSKADVDPWLDGYLPYALASGDIPGAVVVVVKDGQILTARGYGYADRDKRTPVNPDTTLFRPGSVSKLVTWTAVMQLVEQHKLDLDTDVNRYIDFKIPPRDGQPITLRQIMTHTAGFEEAVKDIIFFDPKHEQALGAYLKHWVPTRIFAPGTTPAYSNWATALAGYIVERQSGEPFEAYVERHIFAPLGMQHSSFRQPLPANLVPLAARGYPKPGQPASEYEIVGPGPAGGLASSGTDMGRFMIAHLQDGALGGNRILSPATAQMMHDSPLGAVNPISLLLPLNRMELGFFETNINGREVIGHLGDTEAFHTSLHLFMKDGVGFYVSFNSPGRAGAVGALRTAVFQDFADRYFPDIAPPAGPVDAKTAAQHARMMTGAWTVSRGSTTNFLALVGLIGQTKVGLTAKGGLDIPSLTGLNGRPRDWVEIAPFVWRDANGHDRVVAKVIDGKVERWSFELAGPFEAFQRPAFGQSSTWILPALYASIAVLLLTFLYWPISWLVRRRYKATPDVSGRSLQAYRATRIAAGLDLAMLAGWAGAVTAILTNLRNATSAFDPWLWLLQIAGLIIFIGAVLVSGWNVWLTFKDNRRWTRKLWSVLVLLATLLILYVAWTFGLLAMTVNY